MSRIGKQPVTVPQGVQVKTDNDQITVKGPKGELKIVLIAGIKFSQTDNVITLTRESEAKSVKAAHGLCRAHLVNLIQGVTQGFRKELDLEGVGYRVAQEGKNLKFQLGYSHDIEFKTLDGITLKAEGQNKVVVEGADKQKVGQVAANIRSLRPVEPYKGKGIRYTGEKVRRKEGKSAKK